MALKTEPEIPVQLFAGVPVGAREGRVPDRNALSYESYSLTMYFEGWTDALLDKVNQGEIEKCCMVFCFLAAMFCSLLLDSNFNFYGIQDI